MKSERGYVTRPISLHEEIKMHVLMWMGDVDFNKLSTNEKNSVLSLHDSVSIADALQQVGDICCDITDDKNKLTNERKRFIAIFKSKYLDLTDMNYGETLDGIGIIKINKFVEKLIEQSSDSLEYLNWFFDDFARLEINKKYMPPSYGFVLQEWVVSKYFYANKDKFSIRKKDTLKSERRMVLTKLSVEMFNETQDKELGKEILDFGKHRVTETVFKNKLIEYAKKTNYTCILSQLEGL